MNPIGSSEYQPKGVWESRGAHDTAKAINNILDRDGCWILGVVGGGRSKETKKLQDRVREITSKPQTGRDVKQLIAELTPVLRGWRICFRTGKADRECNRMDCYVVRGLGRWQYRRGRQRPRFTSQELHGMGLDRLTGTVCYPRQATPRRSSVSRVLENGMHGLKGGHMVQGRL